MRQAKPGKRNLPFHSRNRKPAGGEVLIENNSYRAVASVFSLKQNRTNPDICPRVS